MQEQKKLISENELPIPAPSTDTGWKHMRERLDDEMPERAIIPLMPRTKQTSRGSKRGLSLLIALLLTGFIIIAVTLTDRKNADNNKVDGGNATTGFQKKDNAIDKKSVEGQHGQRDKQTVRVKDNGTTITSTGAKRKRGAKEIKDQSQQQDMADHPPANTITPGNDQYIAKNTPRTPLPGLDSLKKDKSSSKADSATTPPPQKPDGWKLSGGVAWNIQIPASTTAYFSGSNTRSQPYRILLPAVWFQAEQDKHLLNVEINPFATTIVPSKTFRSFTTIEAIPDTFVTTTYDRTLSKLFGVSAGFGYAYNVRSNWWVGGNLRACIWTKAIASSKGNIQKDPVNGSPKTTIPFNSNYRISDEWDYFSKFQFYLHAEAMYRKEKWQAGLRAGIAATTLSKDDGPARPFQAELFYRLRLWNTNLDKKKKGLWNQ